MNWGREAKTPRVTSTGRSSTNGSRSFQPLISARDSRKLREEIWIHLLHPPTHVDQVDGLDESKAFLVLAKDQPSIKKPGGELRVMLFLEGLLNREVLLHHFLQAIVDAHPLPFEEPTDPGMAGKPCGGQIGIETVFEQEVVLELPELLVQEVPPIHAGRVNEAGLAITLPCDSPGPLEASRHPPGTRITPHGVAFLGYRTGGL